MLVAGAAWGQAVPSREPTSTHIFPAGGKRGAVVKVRVGGECFPPGMSLHLHGPGVTGSKTLGPEVQPRYEPSVRRAPRDADGVGANMAYPREWDAALTIAADAELGPRYWRVSGAFGGTCLRPFLVGDLPEFIEAESNSEPERAERVSLPVVINGQIAGERDQDYFVFQAKANEVVVCDVMAARIGSPLEPVIALTDAAGRRIERDEVRAGKDPVVAFRAPADGDYRLHVANLSFFGGPAYVYRITLSTRPYAPFAFPPGGRAGDAREVQSNILTGQGSFRVAREKVAFPRTPGSFLLRETVPLIAGEFPEIIEAADNQSAKKAMELSPPVTVNARFLSPAEQDWYCFSAKGGQSFAIQCEPFPAYSAAIPMLTLFNDKDTVLAKAGGADTVDHRTAIDWKAPADGLYRLRLSDLQHGSRGGPEFIYRLTVRPAQSDFSLTLGADFLNVVQGGKTEIDMTVQRIGGYTGPIDLALSGLPDGVKLDTPRIGDGQTKLKVAISAKEDTRPVDAMVKLTGKATIAGKVVERQAVVASLNPRCEALHVTVQHKPLFRITCNEAYQYAHRGSIYPYVMQIERLHGFKEPITLQLCDRQVQDLDGIEMVETVIPAGAKEAKNLIFLPETMHASVQHHCRPYAQGHATFIDKWGQKQTLLAVCDKRCMIRTMPPVAKLHVTADKAAARPGDMIVCKLVLERTSNFAGAVDIELMEPKHIKIEKKRLEAGVSEAVVRIQVQGNVKASSNVKLRFRATGEMANGATVVSEAETTVAIAGASSRN